MKRVMEKVQNLEPESLLVLHGQQLHVTVDIAGLMVDVIGWASVRVGGNHNELGLFDERAVAVRDPERIRADDADSFLDLWFNESTPAINKYGSLVFHADGALLATVEVVIEDDQYRYFRKPDMSDWQRLDTVAVRNRSEEIERDKEAAS